MNDPKPVCDFNAAAKKAAALGFIGLVVLIHVYAYCFMVKKPIPPWLDISFMGLAALTGVATVAFGISQYTKRQGMTHDLDA
ncbi:MAG: hypothetical protein AB7T49_16475 [Oligoflexales bacterium]